MQYIAVKNKDRLVGLVPGLTGLDIAILKGMIEEDFKQKFEPQYISVMSLETMWMKEKGSLDVQIGYFKNVYKEIEIPFTLEIIDDSQITIEWKTK